jgi:hypothetical protein
VEDKIPDFKLQSHSNKNSMVLTQNRHGDQWERIENLDTNPCNYSHLIFDKGSQNIYIREKIDSSKNGAEKLDWVSTCRRLKLNPSFSPCTSINSKCTKDLNLISEMVRLFQEK